MAFADNGRRGRVRSRRNRGVLGSPACRAASFGQSLVGTLDSSRRLTPVGCPPPTALCENRAIADAPEIRHDWRLDEIEAIHELALPDLVFRAQSVHRAHHDPLQVQGCALLSVKTGGCAEDCAYCPQSSRYETGIGRTALLSVEDTLNAAERARDQGATRFCMGAAWRSAPRGAQFERVLEMVRGVRGLGLEACCTLGMLTADQAEALAQAGLTAYKDRKSTRLNSSHIQKSRMPSSA